jgi:triosephosphate isomerase
MRNTLVAGNWKLHKTSAETAELITSIRENTKGITQVDIVVAPPFTALASAKKAIDSSNIGLAAQNLFWEEKGAFTGEIAPGMLVEIGCEWVIIGHSERRQYFGETDETVNRRIKAALKAGLKPIVCVGETLGVRESGKTEILLETQLSGAFDGIGADLFDDTIVIAYEPVWAIGTGKTATPQEAQKTHSFIRSRLNETFGGKVGLNTRIIYGGSVKPENAEELIGQPDVDGALVGGASLKAGDFSDIIRASL